MTSKKPIAKAIKRWLVYEVIPSIMIKGEYSLIQKPNSQSAIVQSLACPRKTICHNPNGFPISSIKRAVYILFLPLLNKYKFGYSNNLKKRLKEHEYKFSEISIELIIETPEVEEIEKRLKLEIRSHGINTVFDSNGCKMKELFEPEHLQQVCDIVRDIVKSYERDSFTNIQNHEYRMECEKTKQEQDKTKQEQEKTQQKKYEIEILRLRMECHKRKIDEMN